MAQEVAEECSWGEYLVQKESQESKENNKSSNEKEHSCKNAMKVVT